MYLRVRCPSCGKSAAVPESDAGLAAVCLACGTRYTIPALAPAPEVTAPTTAAAGAAEAELNTGGRWGRMAWAAAALVLLTTLLAVLLVSGGRPDPVDRETAALYKSQAE